MFNRNRLVSHLFSAAFVVAMASDALAAAGDRVALVIGNGSYAETTQLSNPPNDADDVAAALERLGFEVLKVVDGDKVHMERAVRSFGELLAGADVGLLFYAGHGLQVNGRNYMVPTNARLIEEQDLLFEAIDVEVPIQVMEQSGAKMKLVILDSCRDNPLARGLASSIKASGRSSRVGRGLASIEGASGMLIAYAAAPGDIAADGSGRNSPFTSALLGWIDQPGLEVGLMFRRVRESVLEATGGRQVPWVNEALVGEFYFSGKDAAGAPAPKVKTRTQTTAMVAPRNPVARPSPKPEKAPEGEGDGVPPTELRLVGEARPSFGPCGKMKLDMTLTGQKLTGTALMGGRKYEVKGGMNDDFTLEFHMAMMGAKVTARGKFSGDLVKGEWDAQGWCKGTFAVERKS